MSSDEEYEVLRSAAMRVEEFITFLDKLNVTAESSAYAVPAHFDSNDLDRLVQLHHNLNKGLI